MLVLQLPNQTLESLDKMMRRFWWRGGVNKKKLRTIQWSELCKLVEEGGLGIRKSKGNNLALLSKIEWRRLTNVSLLCPQIIKDKYCLNKSFWKAIINSVNSLFWRGFVNAVTFIVIMQDGSLEMAKIYLFGIQDGLRVIMGLETSLFLKSLILILKVKIF